VREQQLRLPGPETSYGFVILMTLEAIRSHRCRQFDTLATIRFIKLEVIFDLVPCFNELTGQHTQVRFDAACPAIAPIQDGYTHRINHVRDYDTGDGTLSCRAGSSC
jgi:hypothetical protein